MNVSRQDKGERACAQVRPMDNLTISSYSFSSEFHDIHNMYLKEDSHVTDSAFESMVPEGGPLTDFISLPDEVGAEEEIRYDEEKGEDHHAFFDNSLLVKQEPLEAEIILEPLSSGLLVDERPSFSNIDNFLDGPFCTPSTYSVLNMYSDCSILRNDSSLICNFCNVAFKKEISLKKHVKIHQYKIKSGAAKLKPGDNNNNNNIILNNSNNNNINNNKKKNNKENLFLDKTPQVFHCSMCTYQTKRRDKLDKHIQNHVIFEGVHPCGKKRYKPDVPLRRHRHNAEEYKCSLCMYVCTVYKALKKHQKLHVSGLDTSSFIKTSCKICGKDKESDVDMDRHMKKHRGEGKRLYCDLCSFSSVQLKKVIQHRRIHTGERPHLCPFCNYRCARRDNLRAHVRRMHKRDNMYIDTFIKIEEDNEDGYLTH